MDRRKAPTGSRCGSVLDAAMFASKGYSGIKIMDIVREAGLSAGAVYGRFKSKNDLLSEAVVSHSIRHARARAGG